MKRVLLSILIGFVLLSVIMGISAGAYVYFGKNAATSNLRPLFRVPTKIFYYFSPPLPEDSTDTLSNRRIILGLSFFFANVLLYSIPPYLLLTLIARFRKPKSPPENAPPPPPSF